MTEIALIDSARARRLTDQIKVAIDASWELIAEAYSTRAWSVLGYNSWDEYALREFGTSRLRLPREERQEVVSSLREQGLSIRAIVAVTGVSDKTVQSDLRQVSEITTPPVETPSPYVSTNRRTGEIVDEPAADPSWAQRIADELAASDADYAEVAKSAHLDPVIPRVAQQPKIIGTDGKSYAAQSPSKPRRAALTDAFWRATLEFGKRMTTLTNLAADDRFKSNTDQIAQSNLNDLIRVRDALQSVIDQLTTS